MTTLAIQHAIAPAVVLRGNGAWVAALPRIATLCKRPLVLGRSASTAALRQQLQADLVSQGLDPLAAELQFDCCEADLGNLIQQIVRGKSNVNAKSNTKAVDSVIVDAVIAIGGGKVLDAGKLLAHRLGLACITIPTSAATCAGWTALANLYSAGGAFERDVTLDRCPDLLVFDHALVRQAPPATLTSGIADAMAKWYEASVSSSNSPDGLVQQAVQQARVLRDQLMLEAEEAFNNPGSEAWVRVAEASALTAGLIGGVGGASCRTVAAHAVHNGLTQLSACHDSLHGAKVGFGVLVQLRLEELLSQNRLAVQARRQLISLFRKLKLPICLEDLGLSQVSLEELQQVCAFACQPGSDLHHLPFAVSPTVLLAALVSTTEGCEATPEPRGAVIAQAERSQLEATRTGPDA
ncbi:MULTISPECIES: iron-containing alcohol dehydrogenase family protein [Synechococcaceae]|uniref:iron-containing alcohol dehydrogenase family protein n=1 Tax=Synechococcaceae TaxID=1890426 RepID=UPI00223A8297|nr:MULTISPECIES: iron-containing alcohol dehydrogenase family protein [Synechococcaceae]MCT0202758.1 iron-containing alcohol dehydrogenase family protein [Synechococcus sp. CS-603]MCT4363680.1 iron-containing alcohol dehydrogenase family protein [Candidatus Regnicoccus frigidus MAG-AL1]MCT4366852.1 iron-containing alcohol dehydrogenase family protein [Candidatus Regnicoccus frigidus MAG-AL2]